MPSLHESVFHMPLMGARTECSKAPYQSRGQRTSTSVLTLLVLWISAVLVGCGDSPEQVKEQQKEKQQVVQEKMKQFMMEKKAHSKSPR
jgi:hypothetical protein